MPSLDREEVRRANLLQDVIPALTGHPLRGTGAERLTCCPFHEDEHPSLRVNVEKQQWFCDPCGFGGDVFEFVQRHQDCAFSAALRFLAQRAHLTPEPMAEIAETYDYRDEHCTLLFQCVRFNPKDFRQRRPDGNNKWTWNLNGVRRVLYCLPELKGKPSVVITEGEKDANRVRSLGLAATTCPCGAEKWLDKYGYTDQIRAAGVQRIVILPDNDNPGRAHAQQVAASCHAAGLDVRIVSLPGLPAKGDVSDWIDAGHTRDELIALVKAAPLYEPPIEAPETATDVPDSSEPNDLDALLADVRTFTRRYVVLSDDQADGSALWTAHAHAFEAANCTPYLNPQSPEKRTGKTRFLEVHELMVPRPWFTGRVTVAVLARRVDKECPTLLLDEGDAAFRAGEEYTETLRAILNSGYRRGGNASVCTGQGANIGYKTLSTFCPKAIAGIGKLPDTVGDRSIPIIMKRRAKHEVVERFRLKEAQEAARPIRDALARWAAANLEALRAARPIFPDALDDRAADVWEPLFAIADLAGGSWPSRARRAAVALMGGRDADNESVGVQLLADIRQVFTEAGDPSALSSKQIRDGLSALEDRPWSTLGKHEKPITGHALAKRLAGFQVVPAGNIRLEGKVVKGYRRATFEDAWSRYLPDEVLQGNKLNNDGPEFAFSEVLQTEPVADAKTADQAHETETCYPVALGYGEDGTANEEQREDEV